MDHQPTTSSKRTVIEEMETGISSDSTTTLPKKKITESDRKLRSQINHKKNLTSKPPLKAKNKSAKIKPINTTKLANKLSKLANYNCSEEEL